jgi:hypothetical protein
MQEDKLLMSAKERHAKVIFESVLSGHFTLKEASLRLKQSYRQTRRRYQRYCREGDLGLIHKSRGKKSSQGLNFKQEVLKYYQSHYEGFGPTLATEKFAELGYQFSHETLRLWLKEAGLWAHARCRKPYRQRRERRQQFGELLQLDGSIHCWFDGQEGYQCLMNLVDDATGITMALLMNGETTEGALRLLKYWVERYGLPKAIYVDLKTVYVSPLSARCGLNKKSGQHAEIGFTQFSVACAQLGIEIIKAYSPQAKGRVERKHAVFQDRFVKELKLKGIKAISDANQVLFDYFLDQINQKFAQAPANSQDAHRDPKPYGDLEQIFCWKYERRLQNDWTISFQNQVYQIKENYANYVEPQDYIIVHQHLTGGVSLWYEGKELNYTLISKKTKPIKTLKKGYDSLMLSQRARANKHKCPWRRSNPHGFKISKKEVQIL